MIMIMIMMMIHHHYYYYYYFIIIIIIVIIIIIIIIVISSSRRPRGGIQSDSTLDFHFSTWDRSRLKSIPIAGFQTCIAPTGNKHDYDQEIGSGTIFVVSTSVC